MRGYFQHVDPGDENDSERDDVCPRCGEYLPRYVGAYRYSCGDCYGGTECDPQARSWESAATPFAENH